MIVKLTEATYLNALRHCDIIQGIDDAGTIIIMGKYQESQLISFNRSPIKTLINVVIDMSKNETDMFILRGIRYKKLYENTWSFERENS